MPKIAEIEPTPNPNAMKFILREPLTWGITRSYDSAEEARDDALAAQLQDHRRQGHGRVLDPIGAELLVGAGQGQPLEDVAGAGDAQVGVGGVAGPGHVLGGKRAVRVLELAGLALVDLDLVGHVFPDSFFLAAAFAMAVIGPGEAEEAMGAAAGRAVDRLVQLEADDLLEGVVRGRLLLARAYRPSWGDYTSWLNRYGEYGMAGAVYERAMDSRSRRARRGSASSTATGW